MTRILVIDDDRIIRRSLYDGLTLSGDYDVLLAEDGVEGLEIAREIQPDLIICDIDMPRLDGLSVIEILQQDPVFSKIPFIFLTGQSARESVRQGMALGADDYISKPFRMSELLGAIESRLIKISRLETHYEQKLDALRDNILLALPHELRTPLSLIIGFSEILTNSDLPIEENRVLAQNILASGRRLQHLFENYIIYAQIELILTEPDRVERMRQIREAVANPVVEGVVNKQMEVYGRSTQLSLKAAETPLPISTDNLKKIVLELVNNAFKFSPAGTEVIISTQHKGNKFIFAVENQGRGMTREQIAAIGGYMQFERKIHEQQGSGMGLIIAKRLAELFGGTLSIQSVPGTKTKVTVTLPA